MLFKNPLRFYVAYRTCFTVILKYLCSFQFKKSTQQSFNIDLNLSFFQSMKSSPPLKDLTASRFPSLRPTRLTQPWRTSNLRAGVFDIENTLLSAKSLLV